MVQVKFLSANKRIFMLTIDKFFALQGPLDKFIYKPYWNRLVFSITHHHGCSNPAIAQFLVQSESYKNKLYFFNMGLTTMSRGQAHILYK